MGFQPQYARRSKSMPVTDFYRRTGIHLCFVLTMALVKFNSAVFSEIPAKDACRILNSSPAAENAPIGRTKNTKKLSDPADSIGDVFSQVMRTPHRSQVEIKQPENVRLSKFFGSTSLTN